jgi:hypothetical protein
MYALALLAEGSTSLTWKDVLQDIPHDAGAVIVYLMIIGFGFVLWYSNRPSVAKRYHSGEGAAEASPAAREQESATGERAR